MYTVLEIQDDTEHVGVLSYSFQTEAEAHLVAGAYNSSYPISIFAAPGHNSFTIVRVPIG